MLVTMIKTNFVIISYVLRFWIFIFVLKKYTLEFLQYLSHFVLKKYT